MERQEPIAAPYEAMADLIGVVDGGKPGRSAEIGRRFGELLLRGSAAMLSTCRWVKSAVILRV